MRETFKSIGLTNENGVFLGADMFQESKNIAKEEIPLKDKVKKQLDLVARTNPVFDKTINETTSLLSLYILRKKEMPFEKCEIKRVYDKSDKEKNAIMYVYCDMGKEGKSFFVPQNGEFKEMEIQEFSKQYECYQADINKNKGLRFWESRVQNIEMTENNKKAFEEGEER